MGTEILVISYLFVPIIFLVNLGLLFKRRFPNPKALIMLLLNLLFMGYFIVVGYLQGYLVQAFLVGGFLLIPFQLFALLMAALFGSKLAKIIASRSKVT